MAPSSVAQDGVISAMAVRIDVAQVGWVGGLQGDSPTLPEAVLRPRGAQRVGILQGHWPSTASPVRCGARTAHLGSPGHPRMPWKAIQSWFQGGHKGDQGEQTAFASQPDQIPRPAPEQPGRDPAGAGYAQRGEMWGDVSAPKASFSQGS